MKNRRDFVLSSLIVSSSLILPIIVGVFSHAVGHRYYRDRRYLYGSIAVSAFFKVIINFYIYYGMIMNNVVMSAFYLQLWPLLWLAVMVGLFVEYMGLSYLVNRFFLLKRLPDMR